MKKPLKATFFSDYPSRKEEGMDEDELMRSSQYIEWYRASYESKEQRGLFDLWKTVDDYWEGHANEQIYEDDPATNTNIIHPMIEAQVSLMVDDNWEAQPKAQSPSEIQHIPKIKRMLDFVIENNKWLQTIDQTARRQLKYGTGIIKVQYDPSWSDNFGLPMISACNPAYVYPDPNITDVYSIQEGRFIIETMTKSVAWAERKFPEKADLIIPGYEPFTDTTLYDENEYNDSEIQSMHYLHIYVWEKYVDNKKLKLRLTQMSGDGTILDEETDFCSNQFPYFFIPCYVREGTVWAKGDAELLLDQQELINDLTDQIIMNARLTGNSQKWYDPTMIPDGEMLTNEPGMAIPSTGGSAGIGYIYPAQLAAYIPQMRDRIFDIDIHEITRVHKQMSGGRVKGVDTATEALSMQQSGMNGIDYKKKLMAAVVSDMIEYIFGMCLYYWDSKKFFATTGDGEFMSFIPSDMNKIPVVQESSYKYAKEFIKKNPDKEMPKSEFETDKNGKVKYKKAQLMFSFNIGAGLPTNKAFLYTAMKELQAMGNVDVPTANKFYRDQLGLPIPVQDEANPSVPPTPAELQSETENITGLNTSMKTAQGRRADKMSKTPNPSVQGLNANDTVKNGAGM